MAGAVSIVEVQWAMMVESPFTTAQTLSGQTPSISTLLQHLISPVSLRSANPSDPPGSQPSKKRSRNRRLFQSMCLVFVKGLAWTPILGRWLGLEDGTVFAPVDTACPPKNGQTPACMTILNIGISKSGEKSRKFA
jgi:hypothetical protein